MEYRKRYMQEQLNKGAAMVGLRPEKPSLGYAKLKVIKVYSKVGKGGLKFDRYKLEVQTRDRLIEMSIGSEDVTQLIQGGIPMVNEERMI